jgi:hypothetical protein
VNIFDFLLFGLFKYTKAAQCKNLVRYKNIFAYTHTQLNKKPRVIVFYFLIMTRVLINCCSIEELMSLPGIGAKGTDKILEMREAKGDLELEDLSQVPYLRLTPQLIKCLDFTPFEDKEGLGERSGSLHERHRERVRSVDQLVEEWEGTGMGHASEMGKDWGQLGKVPSKWGKSYHSKQEGDWWQQSQSPERLEDEYSELEAAFIETNPRGI